MSDIAVRVEKLGKMYRIGGVQGRHRTLREHIGTVVSCPIRRLRDLQPKIQKQETIWALKNVSFEVEQGEVVGIIGRNGAGKSTLLKILSRITKPTEGSAIISGRVGSLLEVGSGFNPELTGRENIYLNGAILGMKKAEIQQKFDEIVDFSEIEKFIDTPVKHYSSGMHVRLAFAVAAHLEQEILLVDEVLAVGDAAFQKKCLGKIGDVTKGGRTILFVSHNMNAVQRLCRRAIWIDNGYIVEEGLANKVVSSYLSTSFSALTEQVWNEIARAPGNERVRLHRACVRPEQGSPMDPITIQTPFVMEFEYWNLEPNAYLNLSLHIYNEQGILVFNTAPVHESLWQGKPFPKGLFRSRCYVPSDLMNDGIHTVELLAVKDQGIVIFRQENLLIFEISDEMKRRGAWYGKWIGSVRPNLKWTTELLRDLPDSRE